MPDTMIIYSKTSRIFLKAYQFHVTIHCYWIYTDWNIIIVGGFETEEFETSAWDHIQSFARSATGPLSKASIASSGGKRYCIWWGGRVRERWAMGVPRLIQVSHTVSCQFLGCHPFPATRLSFHFKKWTYLIIQII